ncbi:MAG: hypothetical protein HQ483_10640 [Rhodospirillales bacterium]|nr:hypothetical protein [Rhodospirillales bacterium]
MIRFSKMMALLALVICMWGAEVNAEPLITKQFDGHELSKTCNRLPADCQQFILVVANVLRQSDLYNTTRTCIPAAITDEQLTKSVRSWLDKKWIYWKLSAFALVASALAETYPCK